MAEIPGVNAQERTRDQLLATLADVLREALELNRQDALAKAGDSYEEAQVSL